MSAADVVAEIGLRFAETIEESTVRDVPMAVLVASGMSIGISIGLRTAVDDISAARALLRAIEGDIENDDPAGAAARDSISQQLRESVR